MVTLNPLSKSANAVDSPATPAPTTTICLVISEKECSLLVHNSTYSFCQILWYETACFGYVVCQGDSRVNYISHWCLSALTVGCSAVNADPGLLV